MKYLKPFNEELSLDLQPVEYKKTQDGDEIKYHFHLENYDWYVLFTWSERGQKWSRDYDVAKKHYVAANLPQQSNFMQVSKNPLKIASAVTYITQKFIEEYSPKCITIFHINMNGEDCPIDKMNKRSRLNYTFLSKYISGYSLNYYALTWCDSKQSGGTIAVICKDGFEEEFLDWFDMSSHHKKIE